MTLGRNTAVRSCIVLIGLSIGAPDVRAQVGRGGNPPSWASLLPDVPTVTMPVVDHAALLAEDQTLPKVGPFRFGRTFDVDLAPYDSGRWEDLSDELRVWRLRVAAPGAFSINLLLDDFWLPPGAQLYFYNDSRTMQLGAFDERNGTQHRQFAIQPVAGDALTIEYVEPKTGPRGGFRVAQVIHAYRNLFGPEKDGDEKASGDCNIDVNCPDGDTWQVEKRAVARLLLGGSLCTGALINNTSHDGKQYFLTANHCFNGKPQNWVFQFNFEAATCGETTGSLSDSAFGSILRARSSGSDFCLVEIKEPIPLSYEVFYAGWDRSGGGNTGATGIHHPFGDVKKICHDNDAQTKVVWGAAETWKIADWESGVTEPGSSGSPLFDQNHRVIGQLFGGEAACGFVFNDYYGRLDSSWSKGLGSLLDPSNTGEAAIDGLDMNDFLDQDFTVFVAADLPKEVPDASPAGETSSIDVSGMSGFVTELYVTVNATHVRSGDLRLELEGPDGTSVLLKLPAKDDTSANLGVSYGNGDEPIAPLTDLNGVPANGPWTLRASDHEAGETGTIVSWTLGVKSIPASPLEPTHTKSVAFKKLPVKIPDGKKKKGLNLNVKKLSGSVASVAVTLDVEHPRPQDLSIRLIGPDGTAVTLFDMGAGSAYGVATTLPTYTSSLESLDAFIGKKGKGKWRLEVKDVVAGESGFVHDFALHVTAE